MGQLRCWANSAKITGFVNDYANLFQDGLETIILYDLFFNHGDVVGKHPILFVDRHEQSDLLVDALELGAGFERFSEVNPLASGDQGFYSTIQP